MENTNRIGGENIRQPRNFRSLCHRSRSGFGVSAAPSGTFTFVPGGAQWSRPSASGTARVSHYRAGNLKAYVPANQAIHKAILQAAGNSTLIALYRGLAGRVRRERYMANVSPRRWAQAVEEREEILEALAARDGRRLGKILRRHLANKFETVKEALAAQ